MAFVSISDSHTRAESFLSGSNVGSAQQTKKASTALKVEAEFST
jgi:hypothetical protein